ncbi:MAG: redox-regulated ATPase YchF [Nitrospira sp. HN-bin3]|uniref:redox-regulated ATPase YchF n=1 Tax=Nitrospira cf. moscoviensis SBR1015 TaxID=96242 RepID=UPI000A0A7D21|nr:redox-regulated ATPase YchF [Nitrospira cf. moscoviensis SBR1015]MBH0207662.1 redox-regulated ATPase YchF [Nitrospira sp.]OQW34141.1 MAG: redox-regulated ATPase YchF [Nitrospira sp. HN-bin3]
MGLCCGMIGLPNVGKTTVFNALTGGGALAANYPFATVDPNTGVALVPDPRLVKLTEIFVSKKTTYSTLEVRDIAGLVEGASKGEGLGNQFLGHIREVDALLHVVRCFQGTDVVHVSGGVDPLRDIGVIETELMLSDLETLDRRKQKTEKKVRAGDKKAAFEVEFLTKLIGMLDKGEWLGNREYPAEERAILTECQLLSAKPVLFVANVSEGKNADEAMVQTVRDFAAKRGARVVTICGQLEAELSSLPESERTDFLSEMGLTESGLVRLTREAYSLLDLVTFFTAGETESRAWPIPRNTKAPQAAGKIHSDMERGFIRAEVYHYDDLLACGSEAKVKERGLFRLEGKDYVIKEADIVYFRFNV